ncbi:FAD-dependent oxidoreductase [Streptomyces sp. NPDC050617]|uniref:FAD-dependent oxidoreductase n=1 Tax=Streptomyces sp. NPDC050617 TaxID=3154628 RepID=UPI0034365DFA
MHDKTTPVDVAIVGAGPVGLFLARELGLAGCSVLVLEREPELHSPTKAVPLGMRGLSAASVEAFYRRGMLRQLLAASGVHEDAATNLGGTVADHGETVGTNPNPDRNRNPNPAPGADADQPSPPPHAGHFAGMMLDPADVDMTALPFRLPGPATDGLLTHLEAVEGLLSEQAAALGVEIRRGVAVTAVAQDAEGVTVRAGEHEYAARWLVGCDGGRSTVRGLADFEFVGTEPQFTGYVVLAAIADPEKLRPGFNLTPTGMYLRTFTEGYVGMLDCDGGAFDRSQRPTREHLQTVLRRISGTDVTLSEIHLASTFTDRAKQTTTYRRGRVLLAGDAAHIHSPLGGQGLNLGLGDAMNLGWKLAATVHGHAPYGLLDTYTRERHPIGAQVLAWSRAQAAAMRPDPHGQAVQGVLRDLLATRDGTTYAFKKVSGYSQRYDLGGGLGDNLPDGTSDGTPDGARNGTHNGHPLIGRSAPDLRLEDGTRLGDLMRDGRGIALDFSTDQCLHGSALGWKSRMRYVAGSARNDLGVDAVLVRPDGVVAWVGDGAPDREAFERAAGRWFGVPDS